MEKVKGCVDRWTGIVLSPGFQGENCMGNGKHPGKECCCDECDYYLECFPDWHWLAAIDEYLKK